MCIAYFTQTFAQDLSASVTVPPLPDRPQPSTILTENNLTIEPYFDKIIQGQAKLIHVYGPDLVGVSMLFLGDLTNFWSVPNDGYYGLISVNMELTPNSYDLLIYGYYQDDTQATIKVTIPVSQGEFIHQKIELSSDKAHLADPSVERHELAHLESITSNLTNVTLWDDNGFHIPLDATLASPFGAFRIYNGFAHSRHTGWDMKAILGTSIAATASGRVAFAEPLDIRGNYVLIDHGFGIYSGYAHLSEILVAEGDTITAGQIIGKVGTTGRSEGSHFHWDMSINGSWVDGIDFTKLWIPLPIPSATNTGNS